MLLSLNKQVKVNIIEEGLALFDSFYGDTHFLPFPLCQLVTLLSEQDYSEEILLTLFLNNYSENTPEREDAGKQFLQFVTEAKKSGIIIEKD